ncbi:hypothetical protein CHLNCDRAFT_137665 [Chlorella variabilis]|uniref:Uncharacterized protein n=1 Tax=Chlorella variabilis TaxID=554065 RepID=E1Z480_CHLVA|nr:hypothetical protein CHLNCDRAFT_137665 [Chlorella variabilis]EFN59306.1 hypothetical protein CHLNCDRAFT_137665 [Chlorella variabilis]|eukprot:XP_005851408.1 hypothetical protein CHLNCDRAFT_137665 [Chlorella variabilis]
MSGIVDRLRKLSGRATESETPKSEVSSPKTNPWRGVFDPASNPNTKNAGRSYYDTPDPGNPKTTWDYHLDAQNAASHDVTTAAFKAMGAKSTSDELDADALRKMFSADRVENIMQAADKNKAS